MELKNKNTSINSYIKKTKANNIEQQVYPTQSLPNMKLCSCVTLIICLLIAFCALICCGCSCSTNNQDSGSSVSVQTVTDIYGRQVTIPAQTNRIATVGSATRICVYAGATDKLVAVTEMDKPSQLRPYTIAQRDKLENLPTTSNGNHINSTTVDEEQLLSLNPDVILSTRSSAECEKLQQDIGIPVVGVYFQNTIFGDELKNSIKIVGQVAGTSEHAEDVISYLNSVESDLNQRTQGLTNPTTYRGAINYKSSKDITGTISNYCVYQAINLQNIADRSDLSGAYDTSLEQIYQWNPSHIFIDYNNMDKVTQNYRNNKDVFNNIDAVKNNNVYAVASFNNNGTNVEYGLCEAYYTASILHPERFANLSIEEKYDEIFDKLLGAKIYEELQSMGINYSKVEIR